MSVSFSSHNQEMRNGSREYAIWYTCDDRLQRRIGTAFKTRNGDWCANVDNNSGGVTQHIYRRFTTLKQSVREGWLK